MVRAALLAAMIGLAATSASAREAVDASAPSALSVTMYRDPNRRPDQSMNRTWPRGFAMITETRQVTLPPGESTIRFTGVAEGMIAVSAIVTGLPGGTIEKNRNADLLSPASLIDGTLGNRVTVTRTNPATGKAVATDAIVRTRADGGLVLETEQGFEAVRCAGLPEKLTFDRVPAGLSAQPVFSVDTRDASGGVYTVQLTYLAWGFDWQAHYVATLAEGDGDREGDLRMRLMSWLTLLNDNGQSFEDAELLVVAGTLNIVSNFQSLADPPDARPLRLTCYPFGSTAEGTPEEDLYPIPPASPPPPPPPAPMAAPPPVAMAIEVTAQRMARPAMKAEEEALGDLKLYRVPEPVTVAAKSLKQIAFLDEDHVEGQLLYKAACAPWNGNEAPTPAGMLLTTVNDKAHGLGAAMPTGGITIFEPSTFGEQLVGERRLRDYAEGQDVEIDLGQSSQVYLQCKVPEGIGNGQGPWKWEPISAVLSNANAGPVRVRLVVGPAGYWQLRGLEGSRVKDGEVVVELTIPANATRTVTWETRPPGV